MIARIWRGAVRAQDADEYVALGSLDAVKAFAGDDRFLVERDEICRHYDVA